MVVILLPLPVIAVFIDIIIGIIDRLVLFFWWRAGSIVVVGGNC